MIKNKKILIVDDAVFMRSMLKRVINSAGAYEVLEAPNGEAALSIYREVSPDLVFLDISMPGISGIEVLRQMIGINEHALVIMCSAIGQESMIVEALDIGAADFIVKPFKPEQIAAALHKVFPGPGEEA